CRSDSPGSDVLPVSRGAPASLLVLRGCVRRRQLASAWRRTWSWGSLGICRAVQPDSVFDARIRTAGFGGNFDRVRVSSQRVTTTVRDGGISNLVRGTGVYLARRLGTRAQRWTDQLEFARAAHNIRTHNAGLLRANEVQRGIH